jgi:hypothetical protein
LLLLLLHLRLHHRLVDVLVLQWVHALLLELQIRADGRPAVGALERSLARLPGRLRPGFSRRYQAGSYGQDQGRSGF